MGGFFLFASASQQPLQPLHAPQDPQEPPQTCFPCFLSRRMTAQITATMRNNPAKISMEARLLCSQ